jgi:hypothetical protein
MVTLAVGASGLMLSHDQAAITTRLRRQGYQTPLLLDPACYFRDAADNRQLSLLDPEPDNRWLAVPSDQQVAMYLSPSRFVAAGDVARLQMVLVAGQRFLELAHAQTHRAPAMIALPIDGQWLAPGSVDCLVAAVTSAGAPVAAMPGGQMDPLSTTAVVRGLVAFLGAIPQQAALLRTDLAGLGALAYGAVATAIGVSASLRHVVPPGKRAFPQPDPTPRVLVEPLLSWVRGSVLEQIERDGGMLECPCAVCHGRSLRRFGNPRAEVVREAAIHSVLAWRAVADRVLAAPADRRPAVWVGTCAEALELHARLRARTQIELVVPAYLSSWAALR